MKKRTHNLLLFSIVILSFLIIIPVVSARSRNTYIIDFIQSNQVAEKSGFSNSVNEDNIISDHATFLALQILDSNNLLNNYIDKDSFSEKISGNLTSLLDNNKLNTYKLFYLLSSLSILDFIFSNTTKQKILTYLNTIEDVSGGFSPINSSLNPNIISTYYALRSYEILELSNSNLNTHMNWVLSCINSDGGFGANETAPSKLGSTYYAILNLNEFGNLSDLSAPQDVVNFLKGFYVEDGGYQPDINSEISSISGTYFSIETISILNTSAYNDKSKTIQWVLDMQNSLDGGFSETRGEESNSPQSSVISTYYAYSILGTLDGLSFLNQLIGVTDFNWIILIIIFAVMGVIILLGYFQWQRRKI